MDGHLDLLTIDAVRAGEGSSDERDHAARCGECRALLEGFSRLADRLTPPRLEVPAAVKGELMALARPRRAWRPLVAAAAVLIGISGVWLAIGHRPAIPGDVDHNGRVDIIDAYALAVQLRSGLKPDPAFDVNGDGKVDERDVEEIARRSVEIR
jgi:hypothetical protein